MKIFISHSHGDSALADALRELYEGFFSAEKVQVNYSSDTSPGGGIPPGTPWLDWIIDQVKSADRTLVLLTPQSIDKPWLLWEAGAVTGATLMRAGQSVVVPLIYRISVEQVPGPYQNLQALRGDAVSGITRELSVVNEQLDGMPQKAFQAAAAHLVSTYMGSVEKAMADQPLSLTEGAVQEWVSRLECLRAEKRFADAVALEEAMNRAFCNTPEKEPPLLDVRMHRVLGEIYLNAKAPKRALAQFDLALRCTPRDVYLLHKRGLALLEATEVDGALTVLGEIDKLCPGLATRDAEIGGLAGRAWRAKWKVSKDIADLRKARDAYWTVMVHEPITYYSADNAGQLSLLLGEPEKAKEAFDQARMRIHRSNERSVWSLATLCTAEAVLGNIAAVTQHMRELHALSPDPRQVDSILGGFQRLQEASVITAENLATWTALLMTRAVGVTREST